MAVKQQRNLISDEKALENIAANIQRFRGQKSYSQLARECSTKDWTAYPATIEHVEKCMIMPGAGLLARIAAALGVTADVLLADPRKQKRKSA